jgi:hypothetical protein
MNPQKTPAPQASGDADSPNETVIKPQGVPELVDSIAGAEAESKEAAPKPTAWDASKLETVEPPPAEASAELDMTDPKPPLENTGQDSLSEVSETSQPAPSVMPSMEDSVGDPSDEPMAPMDDMPVSPLPMGQSKPRSGKKGLLLIACVVVAFLLLSGGAAAYYYAVVNKPENVLLRALGNTLDSEKNKTLDYSGSVSVQESKPNMKLEGTFEGGLNMQTGAVSVSSKVDALVTNLTFDVRSLDGKTYYLRVGGLDGLANLLTAVSGTDASDESAAIVTAYAPMINAFNNQWVEINQSVISSLTGNSFKTEKLSDADRQKLADAYQNNAFLVVKQKLPDQTIKGSNTYHYALGIDKTKLKAFAAALKTANLDSIKIKDQDLKDFNNAVDNAKFDDYGLEMWIYKSSKMIAQVSLKTSDQTATMSLTLTVNSYNKPFKVEKPAGAKSLLDLISGFYGDSNGEGLTLPQGASL